VRRATRAWLAVLGAAGALATHASEPEERYDALIAEAVARARGTYPVPHALVKAVIRQESGFRSDAVSSAGARGLMQVMPETAARMGVSPARLFDPGPNVAVGVRLLALLLERYEGDIVDALVAYNAGAHAAGAPIPRNRETPAYVWRVLVFYERYRSRPSQSSLESLRGGHSQKRTQPRKGKV
jgi:soluble lytic murein transglycosylase-like protein